MVIAGPHRGKDPEKFYKRQMIFLLAFCISTLHTTVNGIIMLTLTTPYRQAILEYWSRLMWIVLKCGNFIERKTPNTSVGGPIVTIKVRTPDNRIPYSLSML
ncbi:hypothetical protein Ddc_22176 [Ditylenchus destructor]|nr:hypothetical protein Ddc_22176 [Ditylenchus destructor]